MISLTTADQALKDVSLEAISNQLNNLTDVFYSKIEATSDYVSGNTVKKLVSLGMNGGIGAGTEVGGLPTPNSNNYACLTSNLKNLYGQICLSDKAIRASRDEAGAFVDLLSAEMENLVETGRFHLARILYGKGNGYLGYVSSSQNNSNVLTVNNVNNMGIGLRIRAFLNGNEVTRFQNAVITDINHEAKTITISVTMDSANANQALDLYTFDGVNGESIGLAGLCDANITTLYGLNRTTTSFLTPGFNQNSNYTIATLTKVVDDSQINTNAQIDLIPCGFNFRRKLQTLLKASSLNTDVCSYKGGFKTITFLGIPVVASRFISDNYGYLVDSSYWHLHQLCDWTWLTNNRGEVLHQREGYPIHTATLAKYCELMCDRPETVTFVKWSV